MYIKPVKVQSPSVVMILFLTLVAAVSCSLVPYYNSYPVYNDYGNYDLGYGYQDLAYEPYGISNGYGIYGYPGFGNLNYGHDALGFR
ncbi:hypothetical protein TNCV_4579741 [Trichonephila clavipes]|nr:hypothetical protein TNCV_4579741 [Trichonephila clavipes]